MQTPYSRQYWSHVVFTLKYFLHWNMFVLSSLLCPSGCMSGQTLSMAWHMPLTNLLDSVENLYSLLIAWRVNLNLYPSLGWSWPFLFLVIFFISSLCKLRASFPWRPILTPISLSAPVTFISSLTLSRKKIIYGLESKTSGQHQFATTANEVCSDIDNVHLPFFASSACPHFSCSTTKTTETAAFWCVSEVHRGTSWW